MKNRSLFTGIILSILLAACAPEVTGPIAIGEITAGTKRASNGEITDAGADFRTTDNPLYFNVEMENVTEPTPMIAYWMLEDDTGSFTRVPLTVTTREPIAYFELSKDSPWPIGEYVMYVEAGTGAELISKTFQYRVKE